jgi:hypothetical protein
MKNIGVYGTVLSTYSAHCPCVSRYLQRSVIQGPGLSDQLEEKIYDTLYIGNLRCLTIVNPNRTEAVCL